MSIRLRIGTRGSPLAMAQTTNVRDTLAQAHGWNADEIEIVRIKTTGDLVTNVSLDDVGGKEAWTKQIDEAMLAGRIDIGVHSAKDVVTFLPAGITIPGYMPREDARDVLIAASATRVADLPRGGTLGSNSKRRCAQALHLRPDLKVDLLRGNVETRLNAVRDGKIDATFLALAGLKRLGLADRATAILDIDQFLPAAGQGAVAITARENDAATYATLAPIMCKPTGMALAAERAFLAVLDGSCKTPIAGHARMIDDDRIAFRGMVLRSDGSEVFEDSAEGFAGDAASIGKAVGERILARLPSGILSH